MEITDEQKSKIFSLYLGCEFISSEFVDTDRFCLNAVNLSGGLFEYEECHFVGDCKLLLNMLEDITDEDAVNIICATEKSKEGFAVKNIIRNGLKISIEFKWKAPEESTMEFYHSTNGYDFGDMDNMKVPVYQYLLAKEYDLPHYLLEGKTLIESDLAVDIKTLNL